MATMKPVTKASLDKEHRTTKRGGGNQRTQYVKVLPLDVLLSHAKTNVWEPIDWTSER